MRVIDVWKIIFSKPRYIVLTIGVAALFYFVNVVIIDFATIASFISANGFFASIPFIWVLSVGLMETITVLSFVSLLVVSVLLGMLISIVSYKVHIGMSSKSSKRTSLVGSAGVALAAIAPGCAVCGLGILPVLGVSTAFLTVLPFHGVELSFLAIAIVGHTVYRVSKGLLVCENCQNYILTNENTLGKTRARRQVKGG